MKSLLRALTIVSLLLPFSIHAADVTLSEGMVKKVDVTNQRIMLAHGPIDNIGMGPMTMMFRVKSAAMLKKVREGSKVRFRVEEVDGEYTVVRIEAAQ